jgi:hypothetical protein
MNRSCVVLRGTVIMLVTVPTAAAAIDSLSSQTGNSMTPQMTTVPRFEYRPAASAPIPQQRSAIRLSLEYEIGNWCKTMRCDEWELREAVRAVGPGPTAVRSWLLRNGLPVYCETGF